MTESILNVGTHLIDDGYDEFIMITADPLHVESVQLIFYTLRNKRKNMQNPRCSQLLLITTCLFGIKRLPKPNARYNWINWL